jgi:hypothetical protein
MSVPAVGGLRMNRMLLALSIGVTILGTATATTAQTAIAEAERPFRFPFEETDGPRGLAVEGYVYNALPWRITNVRLRVDSIDENGTVVASAWGWSLGDVVAGSRGYFYVPVAAKAAAYRASVQGFNSVRLERPAPQAP